MVEAHLPSVAVSRDEPDQASTFSKVWRKIASLGSNEALSKQPSNQATKQPSNHRVRFGEHGGSCPPCARGRPVEVRLLGTVEVWAKGRKVELGPRKQRLMLAILALNVN